jgi:hypothetical protein
MFICTNDRYTPTEDSFNSVDAFMDMCRACFGEAPELTARNGGNEYTDSTGAVVLRRVFDMSPYTSGGAQLRAESIRFEDYANEASLNAANMRDAGNYAEAARTFERAALHALRAANARYEASGLDEAHADDVSIAEALIRDARTYADLARRALAST